MKILVVQPHLDDAFFSLTETAMTWVEDGHEVHLLTVFGGVPPEGSEHHLKYITLWQEYEAAIERGPFEHYLAYEYFDDAARVDQLMAQDLVDSLRRSINLLRPDTVVGPAGIHHPDHGITAAALCVANDAAEWLYDELPYYVLWPEHAIDPRSTDRYEREGSRDHLAAKQRICHLFGSQMGPALERTLWCPERVWRPA